MTALLASEDITIDTGLVITVLVIIALLCAIWWLWAHRR
jgi:hypothetical protein